MRLGIRKMGETRGGEFPTERETVIEPVLHYLTQFTLLCRYFDFIGVLTMLSSRCGFVAFSDTSVEGLG